MGELVLGRLHALAPGLRADTGDDWRSLEDELNELANGLSPQLLDLFTGLDRFSALEMAKSMGINLRADPRLNYASQAFVSKNVKLIKDMTGQQLGTMRQIVNSAVGEQLSYSALSEQIQDRLGVVGSRADLIARDQVLKANSQLSQFRAEAVGVRRYTWSSSQDERVRPDHARLNGQVFSYAEPPVVDLKSGRRDNPGQDFQCRCLAIPQTDDLLFGP